MNHPYRRLILPSFILVLLIVSWVFRWGDAANTSENADSIFIVLKWEVDRWTGQTWMDAYSFSKDGAKYNSFPCNKETKTSKYNAIRLRDNLTLVWRILFGLTLVWLIISIYYIEMRKKQIAQEKMM